MPKRRYNILDFLLVSDRKLKVTLTKEDAEALNFSVADADYDTAENRRTFRKILDEAKDAVGFSSKGDKILIQFYPSRDGGCEIFITRLAPLDGKSRLGDKYENVTVLDVKHTLYSFPDIEALGRFAKAAADRCKKRTDAYIAESGVCFLDIEEDCRKDADEYCYITEFASACSHEFRGYVREHCKLLYSGNAIQRLRLNH